MHKRMLFALLLSLLIFPASIFAAEPGAVPKNVIVMIGDGMSIGQVTAARVVKGSLELERCSVGGFSATHSADKMVTDSAAGGTALATGLRTNNGMVAMLPDGTPIKTLLEHAKDVGKSAGIVVTCSVTHATPATFVAHVDSRSKQTEVAEQIAAGNVDVVLGGGQQFFTPKSASGSKRKDNQDLIAVLRERMPVALTVEELRGLGDVDSFAGLLAPDDLGYAADRVITLAEMVRLSLQALSKNPNGFALMVEGSLIDWADHANDEPKMLAEMTSFDDAIGAALDFAETDGNTLVVVTADHDTGGYTLLDGSLADKKVTKSAWVSGGHTAIMVPVFAYGPGADALGGIHNNSAIGQKLIEYVEQSSAKAAKSGALVGAAP
ncbi:MAG TPA: alkaline phosphatase [Candidatus Hydrogenedentes bacterium]|jgi:alkaline phosphatase|nr:alkaline phosphatase [Candidatus Hydrogenedentota bacterium]HPJ98465.1 alkaline phosphatase [Candidatus Hydrogenedentota bacterium]